jgi:hypothetical protein
MREEDDDDDDDDNDEEQRGEKRRHQDEIEQIRTNVYHSKNSSHSHDTSSGDEDPRSLLHLDMVASKASTSACMWLQAVIVSKDKILVELKYRRSSCWERIDWLIYSGTSGPYI